jgi:molecular chaperone GrpE
MVRQKFKIQKMTKKHEKPIEKEETALANLENQLKRALADYQNLEKRIAEEKSSWIKTSNKGLILKLLPVLDDLFLAQDHLKDEGLVLTIQKFVEVLRQDGVTLMPSLKGLEFDPNLMEAVGTTEGDEGKVIEQVRAGYKIHENVLRPAQVIVGKGV